MLIVVLMHILLVLTCLVCDTDKCHQVMTDGCFQHVAIEHCSMSATTVKFYHQVVLDN